MRTVIEIEHLRAGQPRPYADSIYEAAISAFSAETLTDDSGKLTKGHYAILNEAFVKMLCRMFVRGFKEKPGPTDARLVYCAPTGPSQAMMNNPNICRPKKASTAWLPKRAETRWLVQVVEPYTG